MKIEIFEQKISTFVLVQVIAWDLQKCSPEGVLGKTLKLHENRMPK